MTAIAIPRPIDWPDISDWLRKLFASFMVGGLLLTAATAPVDSADHFVDGSCANHGDGTTADCAASPGGVGAWNDLPFTNAECTVISAGDIVEIADNGEFDYEAPNANNGYDWDTACDGSAGNHIVFRNKQGDTITITGFLDDSAETWSAQTNNDFLCLAAACGRDGPSRPTGWHAWYANGGPLIEVNYSAQTRSTFTCGDGLPTNTIFMDANGDICVNLGGLDPSAMDYFRIPHARMVMDLNDTTFITWQRHPNDSGQPIRIWGAQAFGVFPAVTGNYIFDGVEIAYVEDRCINTGNNANQQDAFIQVLNSKIYNCGQEGIRIDSRDSTSTLVQDTEVFNIQHPAMFPVCTGTDDCPDNTTGSDNGTGIRLAKSSNVQVIDTTMHDVGGGLENNNVARGIDFESDAVITPQSACENCIVDGFYLYDSTPGNMYSIHVGGSQTRNLGTTIVKNSRFNNVDNCLRLASGAYSGTLKMVNNTCLDFQAQGVNENSLTGSLALIIRNSIFESDINPTQDVIEANDVDITLTFESNLLFLPNATATDVAIDDNGTEYLFDVGCTPSSNCIQDRDANSDDATATLFENKGAVATDLTLQSTGSNAFEAGVADADVTLDFLGTTRSAPPDIGAHEF